MDRQESHCFGCGPANPIGLKLAFCMEGDSLLARFTPGENHEGYPGVMHGGLISTLLDEVMANLLFLRGTPIVTAKLEVKFRAPVPIGHPVTAIARPAGATARPSAAATVGHSRATGGAVAPRVFEVVSELRDESGRLLAEGRGVFIRAPDPIAAMRGPVPAVPTEAIPAGASMVSTGEEFSRSMVGKMDRNQAVRVMEENVRNANLRKHILAVEAVMRCLARRFGEDEERWGLAGLLHDLDYEVTKDDPDRHSLVGAEMCERLGVEPEVVDAVRAHNERHGLPRETALAKALHFADPVTGLVVAAALINPEKKLAAIDASFVMKRFGEKAFARGANREVIKRCAELGLELEEFVGLAVEAMTAVAADLGL
jgi:putative nucleotidyltransferase with HDIG domain